MDKNFALLYQEACHACGFEYRDLAKLYNVSLRTVQRHHGRPEADITPLIEATRARNVELARQLAQAAGMNLEKLGLVPPPPPRVERVFVPTPVEPPPARREHADSVLVAAAHALNLPPEAVRPAVAAALARAGELAVSVPGLAEILRRPVGGAPE
ncbi:MAG: hypothetical protein ACYDCL_05645 [Myxococcales bacterium]